MSEQRRSYRELQADAGRAVDEALGQLNGPHECPACGHRWHGSSAPGGRPSTMPAREDAAARAAALEPTATRLAAAIGGELTEVTFHIWIAPLQLADVDGDRLFIAAPAHVATWVAERFAPLIARLAGELAGRQLEAVVFEGRSTGRTLGDLRQNESAAPSARRLDDAAPDDDKTGSGPDPLP